MAAANSRPSASVDVILRNAWKAFATFPGPGLAYFAIGTVWNCYGLPVAGGGLDLADAADALQAQAWLTQFLVAAAAWLLLGWIMCGVTRAAIAGVRGQPVSWNDTLVSLSEYFHAATAAGTWLTAVAFGLLLLVVPGVLIGLMWSQAFCCALDQGDRWRAALGRSRRITRGHSARILVVALVVGLLLVPGQVLQYSALWGSLPDFDAILAGGAASAQSVTFDAHAIALMIAGAAFDAAAYTAMCYLAAALYVPLQDAFTATRLAAR